MGTSIFNLVAITQAAVGDVIPIVDISEAPDITRKITIGDVQKTWFVQVDANAQNLIGLAALTLTGNINMSDGTEIRWAGDTNRRIFNNTSGTVIEVPTGDVITLSVNSEIGFVVSNFDTRIGTNYLHFNSTVGLTPGGGVMAIWRSADDLKFNVSDGDFFEFSVNQVDAIRIEALSINLLGHDVDNIQNLIHDLSTATSAISFANDELQEISISANTTFTGTGYAIGKSKVLKITTDGTLRTLTFPSGWVFLGTKPADQAASKTGILSLTSFTAAEAGVVASYGVEE